MLGKIESTRPLLSSTDAKDAADDNLIDSGDGGDQRIPLFRAVAVLTNIITGVGLLGIPYCFTSGVGTNLVVILSIAALSFFSFSVLVECAFASNIIDYPRLMSAAFPGKRVQWVIDLSIAVLYLGGSILYMQFSSSLIQNIFSNIDAVPSFLSNRWFIAFVIQFVIIFPLVFLKSMSSLSFVSLVSMFLMFCYIVHSIYFFVVAINEDGFDPEKKMVIFKFDINHVLPSLSVQATSYTCHPSVFPTLVKLERPTKARLNLVLLLVTIVATVLYLIGGIIPYFTLFDDIQDPVVLDYYDPKNVFTLVIKSCYSVILILTVPMLIFASRLSFNNLIFNTETTTRRHIIMGLIILVFGTVISASITQVNLMFGIIGGVISPLIVYIFPSIFYLRICINGSRVMKGLAILSITIGAIFIPVCLYDSIKSIIKAVKGDN